MKLVERRELFGFATDDYWLDTGRPDQYLQANLDLVRGIRDGGVDGVHPGAVVDPESIIVESVIGSAARVDRGARITDSLLHQNGQSQLRVEGRGIAVVSRVEMRDTVGVKTIKEGKGQVLVEP